jgi:diaminopimelate epimerase
MPGQQAPIEIQTDAGVKRLELLSYEGGRYTFRAAMGTPEQVAKITLDVGGTPTDVITLRVGNPQCVVLGEVTDDRLQTIASKLAVHPHFPEGTNVELAAVEAPDRVRILIWERGVGPTEASGTGACAAAVAAIQFGGAARDLEIVSPGGSQRVEWTDDGLFLTGWAELIAEAAWLAPFES